jgi:hypothetical protein
MKNYAVLLVMLAIGFAFASCSKDKQTQPAVLNIRLTDAPADYDAVNIEVLRVLVNADADVDTGWIEMAVTPGIYNLLDYTAGNSTLIASAPLNVTEIKQIRLILGNNNTVVIDGVETHLDTPSASQSGLKLKVNQTLNAGVEYTALLDFDASKSVVKAGASGKYILKPVIRLIFSANTGSIKGTIEPVTENCLVEVKLNDTVSLSSYSDNGLYLIPGVPAGTYAVVITTPTESLYNGAIIDGIVVNNGETTTVDKVVLVNKP